MVVEGTGGVGVSSVEVVLKVDASGLFLLAGPEAALFARIMLYNKNMKFRIYEKNMKFEQNRSVYDLYTGSLTAVNLGENHLYCDFTAVSHGLRP